MSKFNTSAEGKNATLNYMGGKSFTQPEKEELAFAVLSSFIEGSYYEGKNKRIERIKSLVAKVAKKDPLFVAKLAYIVRKEFHLRSAYHVLVAELARVHKGDSLVKNLIGEATERPDDLMEIVAYLGKPLPNAVKKGIVASLTKFSAYQLAKYKSTGKKFSLYDLLNLTHPVPPEGKEAVWKKLMTGKLKPPNTWEVRLSSGENKKQVWGELVGNGEIGYMALLRNLRNILKDGDRKTIMEVCKTISNKEAVLKSKQLPFRFLSAAMAIEERGEDSPVFEKESGLDAVVRKAIVKAVTYSVRNIPLLPGRTVILSDNSGSMRGDVGGESLLSAYSSRKTSDIANLFAVLYWLRADNTLIGLFGDRLITPVLDRDEDVFYNFKIINTMALECGPGTETGIFIMLEKLIKDKVKVDRMVIFSDCQVGTGCQWYDTGSRHGNDFNRLLQQYKKMYPEVKVYSVDLKGYGNALFSDGVVQLSGWSDKIFQLMEVLEQHQGLIKWIEAYPVTL